MQKLLGIEKELSEEEAKSMELSAEVCYTQLAMLLLMNLLK